MARWHSVAAVLLTIGFGIAVVAVANSSNPEEHEEVYGLIITGYLCYLLAMILALMYHFDVVGHKVMAVVGAIAAFLAALFLLVGYGLWADKYQAVTPYTATLFVTSAFLAIVGGALLLISFIKGDSVIE